jgi:hypothetical protein
MTGPATATVTPLDVRQAASACHRAPRRPRAHEWGRPDASGFAALACDEMLVHTSDIAVSLGASFDPPRELCARVRARLFPWAPHDEDPWQALRWANGRTPMGARPRLAPNWVAHPAPLGEWDGLDRTAPPNRARPGDRHRPGSSTFPPPDAWPRGTGRNWWGRCVTVAVVGRA